jgi:hypothetical protein
MTKQEEILGDWREAWDFSDNRTEVVEKDRAIRAMDEYAKEQAIAFAKWTAENLWTVYGDQWYPYQDEDNPVPASKLYEKFLEFQQQTTNT